MVACLFCIILYGCKKDQQPFPEPVVLIISPVEDQIFNVYDTIHIQAEINHYKIIKQIGILITDADLKPVSSSQNFQANSESVTLKTSLVINNQYLEGSVFYLQLKIDDGQNIYNHWQRIGINELTKRLEDLLIATQKQDLITLFHTGLYGDVKSVKSWNSDYIGGYADSKYRMYYSAGNASGELRALPLDSVNNSWTAGSGSPFVYTSFSARDGKVVVSDNKSEIKGYDTYGNVTFTSEKIVNGYFKKILALDKHVIGYFEWNGGIKSDIYIFNYPAGNAYAIATVTFEVIDLVEIDELNFFIIERENESVKLYRYNIPEKMLTFVTVLTCESVKRVTGDKDNLFLLTDNAVLWHRVNQSGTTPFITMPNILAVRYSGIEGMLFAGVGNRVLFYKIPSATITNSIEVENEIIDINLLYNK